MQQTIKYNKDIPVDAPELDGQRPHVRLVCYVAFDTIIGDQESHRLISINLGDTSVSATTDGALAHYEDDDRGWYLDMAEVKIAVHDKAFMCIQDSPSTWMGQGELTSSSSVSVNVSAGTMGSAPMASVGEAASWGTSFSTALPNFIVKNDTIDNVVIHKYKLASSMGGSYNSPDDLVDMSAGGFFKGGPLFDLPAMCTDNMPIVSQAIFASPSASTLDVCALSVSITLQLSRARKTFMVAGVKTDPDTKMLGVAETFFVEFQRCNAPPTTNNT